MGAQTRLVLASPSTLFDFIFKSNPTKVDRTRAAQYADVPLALDDAGPNSQGRASEWGRNRPEIIKVEFALYVEQEGEDIEDDLDTLDRLMEKDERTGEPPDLIFTHGPRSDLVRIDAKDVHDKNKYTPDLRMQWAEISLTLRTIHPRR